VLFIIKSIKRELRELYCDADFYIFFFFPPFEQCWKRNEGRSRDGRSSVGSGKEMKIEKQLPGAFIAGI
jgi:hypothetical protein